MCANILNIFEEDPEVQNARLNCDRIRDNINQKVIERDHYRHEIIICEKLLRLYKKIVQKIYKDKDKEIKTEPAEEKVPTPKNQRRELERELSEFQKLHAEAVVAIQNLLSEYTVADANFQAVMKKKFSLKDK
jgi:seryl-tRNA synthetase